MHLWTLDKRPKYLKSVCKKKKKGGGGGDFLFSPLLRIENFNKFKPNGPLLENLTHYYISVTHSLTINLISAKIRLWIFIIIKCERDTWASQAQCMCSSK